MGVIGYGFALAGLVAAVLKLFIPEMGLWIGSWGVVWGVTADAARLMRRTAASSSDGISSMHR